MEKLTFDLLRLVYQYLQIRDIINLSGCNKKYKNLVRYSIKEISLPKTKLSNFSFLYYCENISYLDLKIKNTDALRDNILFLARLPLEYFRIKTNFSSSLPVSFLSIFRTAHNIKDKMDCLRFEFDDDEFPIKYNGKKFTYLNSYIDDKGYSFAFFIQVLKIQKLYVTGIILVYLRTDTLEQLNMPIWIDFNYDEHKEYKKMGDDLFVDISKYPEIKITRITGDYLPKTKLSDNFKTVKKVGYYTELELLRQTIISCPLVTKFDIAMQELNKDTLNIVIGILLEFPHLQKIFINNFSGWDFEGIDCQSIPISVRHKITGLFDKKYNLYEIINEIINESRK